MIWATLDRGRSQWPNRRASAVKLHWNVSSQGFAIRCTTCVCLTSVQILRRRFAGSAPINLCSIAAVLLGANAKRDSEGAAAGAVSDLFFVGQKAFALNSYAVNARSKTYVALLP